MIIELAIGAGVLAAGALALRSLRRRQAARALPDDADAAGGEADEEEARGDRGSKKGTRKKGGKTKRSRPRESGPRGFKVDDVLLYADTELWLAGCFELDEEGFVCRLFRAPGSTRASWVAQLDPAADQVALLTETGDVPGGAVPESLPIGGLRLRLSKRGHAEVTRRGEQLPPASERAAYAILSGPGGKIALVVDFDDDRLALAGEKVGRELLDLLPGADA